MLTSLRLPLENKKYAYIEVENVFNGNDIEIHIIDRNKPKSGVSIFECIDEVQEQLIEELGAEEFGMHFLSNTKWYLYSKTGKVGEFRSIGGVKELKPYYPELNTDLVKLAMERSGIKTTNKILFKKPEFEQLALF